MKVRVIFLIPKKTLNFKLNARNPNTQANGLCRSYIRAWGYVNEAAPCQWSSRPISLPDTHFPIGSSLPRFAARPCSTATARDPSTFAEEPAY